MNVGMLNVFPGVLFILTLHMSTVSGACPVATDLFKRINIFEKMKKI